MSKLNLREKWERIPLNEKGDPEFPCLTRTLGEDDNNITIGVKNAPSVLECFTEQQVCEMVNRYLYQANYQRESHKKGYAAKRTTREPKPIGRPKGSLNNNTTRSEVKELNKVAQKEAHEHLEQEDEAMERWMEQRKENENLF